METGGSETWGPAGDRWGEEWRGRATNKARKALKDREIGWLDPNDLVNDAIEQAEQRIARGESFRRNPEAYAMWKIPLLAVDEIKASGRQDRKRQGRRDVFAEGASMQPGTKGASTAPAPSAQIEAMDLVSHLRGMIVDKLTTAPAGRPNAIFDKPTQAAAAILNLLTHAVHPLTGDRRPSEAPEGIPAAYWLAAPDAFDASAKEEALKQRIRRARKRVAVFGEDIGLRDALADAS